MARPKAVLVVTAEQRQTLDSMAHRARTAPLLARRARIVLACATGLRQHSVAKKLRMSQPTVGRWRQRFIDKRRRRVVGRTAAGHAATDRRHAGGDT